MSETNFNQENEYSFEEFQKLKIKVKIDGDGKEDYVTPLLYRHQPKSKKKLYIVVFDGSFHYLAKTKVVDDFYLNYKNKVGKTKKIVICHDPSDLIIPNWKPYSAKKFLVWYTDERAECTHDPSKISYDIPVVENIVKYVGIITESQIPRAIAEAIKGKKGFWDNFIYIIFLLNNIFWFIFVNAQAEHYVKIITGA